MLTARLCSGGILLCTSLVGGLVLPTVIYRYLRTCSAGTTFLKTISLLNCFAGGVFLATCLVDLLPEGREKMEEGLKNKTEDFPLTELITGIGFLFILFIESVAVTCHRRQATVKSHPVHNTEEHVFTMNKDNNNTLDDNFPQNQPNAETSQQTTSQHMTSHCVVEAFYSKEKTNFRNVLLIIALSIHMAFEGLELGLIKDDKTVWSLLLAVAIHKTLIFFTTGLTLVENFTLKRFIISMVYMSLVSPVGVVTGVLISTQETSPTMTTVSAVLQILAVGTFFYVVFFEILWKEFLTNDEFKISKSFLTVIGFSVFAVIKYSLPE